MRGWLARFGIAALVSAVLGSSSARAIPCPNCFAVFLMPDTQAYTVSGGWGSAPNDHLDLITRYICANRTAFREPATGKEMPILMVLELGDMVDGGTPTAVLGQWQVISDAFDNLDNCNPVVPYVVAVGNHETQPRNFYSAATTNFQTFFGADRWAAYQCADPANCDWDAGEWFIGGGDPVAAFSRNNIPDWEMTLTNVTGAFVEGDTVNWGVDGVGVVQRWQASTSHLWAYQLSGSGAQPADPVTTPGGGGSGEVVTATVNTLFGVTQGPGPPSSEPGRHRVAVIRAPNGQRWLFLGLEVSFDFPPALHPSEGDDSAFLIQAMNDYAGAPTVIAHHSLFNYGGGYNNNTSYFCDSRFTTKPIWDALVEPFPQVVATFNANIASAGLREDEWLRTTAAGYDVFAAVRNYAGGWYPKGWSDGGIASEGNGWNAIAVFDPDAEEIRVRSYRIDDTDADGTYDGVPEATENLDMDFNGRPPVTIPFTFADTRPESLDNCPGFPNPDQLDTDGDGVGDACENRLPGLGLVGLSLLIGFLAAAGGLYLRPARRRRVAT
jgi:hypothetical protein